MLSSPMRNPGRASTSPVIHFRTSPWNSHSFAIQRESYEERRADKRRFRTRLECLEASVESQAVCDAFDLVIVSARLCLGLCLPSSFPRLNLRSFAVHLLDDPT